ncbi:hypothetical protein EDB19DRAFT_1898235 [Suillus lakei]|nr:hypothetical protein EDB19DRAFT_1898235 [Suillus lakei]
MEATHKQPHTAPPDTPLQNTEDLARKVAEAKRRVAEAQMKLAVKDDPYVSVAQTGKKNHPVKLAQQGASSKMPSPVSIFEVKPNPCASSSTAAKDGALEGAPNERHGHTFHFNPQEAQLKALKQRIAESPLKAGLDSEFGTLEKNIKQEYSPTTYHDLYLGFSHLNIRTQDWPITLYVRPVP